MPKPPASTHERLTHSLAHLVGSEGRVSLADLATAAGLSPFHFQRTFRRWVGLSPQQVGAFTTVARAKGPLRAARSVLDVALDLGLLGPSRLHDHFVTVEALTPGEWAAAGLDLTIAWGCGPTPLGEALIAWTPRGICRLHFLDDEPPLGHLRAHLPDATFIRNDAHACTLLAKAFTGVVDKPLPLVVRGTHFQIAVWRALLEQPRGSLTSYGVLAATLGAPLASRAVGTAVGSNPIAVLIPCHRVITMSGMLGGYRWGIGRKCALLAKELHASAKKPQSSLRRAK